MRRGAGDGGGGRCELLRVDPPEEFTHGLELERVVDSIVERKSTLGREVELARNHSVHNVLGRDHRNRLEHAIRLSHDRTHEVVGAIVEHVLRRDTAAVRHHHLTAVVETELDDT